MNGEAELRTRVRRHIEREGRLGIDGTLVNAVNVVIDSHIIEMQAALVRQHKAEDTQLGELDAELVGLAVKFCEEERIQAVEVKELEFQRRSARRMIEDRDTPMPAGPDGEEEPGYQLGNVGVIAARRFWAKAFLLAVLLIAMFADVITFRQVIERMVNDTFVLPLVLALTVTTTYVAHKAGDAFRRAAEKYRNARRTVDGWTLSAIWLAMGIGAFVFRLLTPSPVGVDAGTDFLNGGSTSTAASGSPALAAVLLLLLYVLTGAIALTTGYHHPRDEISQYRSASRRLRKAAPQLAAIRSDLAEAGALRQQLAELRTSRKEQYAAEAGRCRAAAQRLKAEVIMVVRRLLRGNELGWLRRIWRDRVPLEDDLPIQHDYDAEPVDPTAPTDGDRDGPGSGPKDEDPPDA